MLLLCKVFILAAQKGMEADKNIIDGNKAGKDEGEQAA